ncbi:MAG TPA: response regulator [Candidatus Magasanikbacteria bacterium]|uniref:Two component transcriptional regulator, winged helix family n=1 Tax=Candidatus Magasanikbacteria bacterium GW2011_GWA2_41_55 TaxID=1619038 RepID=A0A0G0WKU2_9BACT|nr:MAG: Two component transcriptional regulator, winged helix family [Candidatus Magasanikbacteria bacterium GW2011_GWA2_41_55]HBV58338.1 response regulator [Candidatus Magasanikbacteria bacterium]HBX16190.1 response regulator [Candidatus Magasanikbacteria bacterium]
MAKEGKTKILIVEDDEFLANIYQTKFEIEGFKVFVAGDGEQGLKMAGTKEPEIILLDVLLPKLDGFAVLEQLKKDSATKDIPVILLTNLGQKEDVQKGLKMGAVDYLIKAHFKPSETVDKVKKVLSCAPCVK